MDAEVLAVTGGEFFYDGPMWTGRQENLGTTVWLRQGGVDVVVISRPQQPIDLALCRSLGLDVAAKKWVSVKSAGHFRSGFEAIAGDAERGIFNVDGATMLSHNFRPPRNDLTRLGRKVYPLHTGATFDPGPGGGARL